MKILHQYALKNLWNYRKRTIAIIMGIILSTAMITSITTLTLCAREGLIKKQIETFGDFHSVFYSVKDDVKDRILYHDRVESTMQVQPIGVGNLKGSQNEYKPYISVQGFDETALKNLPVNLIKGRFPKTTDEIILSDHIRYNAKVDDYKIGDTIQLDLGKRQIEENKGMLPSSYPYEGENEKLIDLMQKSYTVVGYFDRPAFEPKLSASYTAITAFDDSLRINNDIYIKFNDINKTVELTRNIDANLTKNEVPSDPYSTYYSRYKYNYDVLMYYNALTRSRSSFIINIVAAFTAIVVLIGSATLLYNSFSVSMRKEHQNIALLQSIGATRSQIRSMVLFEGVVIALIAIPIGLVIGLLAVTSSLGILNQLILESSFQMSPMKFTFSWEILVLCGILIFSIIELCVWLPSRRKSNSLIEDLRSEGKLSVKKYSIMKGNRHFTYQLAKKHIRFTPYSRRNIMISLITLMVLFVSFHSLMMNVQNIRDEILIDPPYDVALSFIDNKDDDLQLIRELETENNYVITDSITYSIFDVSNINKDFYKKWQENGNSNLFTFVHVEDHIFEKILKGSEFDNLSNADKDRIKKSPNTAFLYNKITLDDKPYQILDEDSSLNELVPTGPSIELHRMENNLGFIDSNQMLPIAVVNESTMNMLRSNAGMDHNLSYTIYFQTSDSIALENELKNLPLANEKDGFLVRNYDRENSEVRSVKLLTNLLFYGFMSLVFVVGFVNILNTVHSEYQSRSREFAMLMSIGMKRSHLFKMLLKENMLHMFYAWLISLLINFIITYILSILFKRNYLYFDQGMNQMIYLDYLYCLLIGFFFTIVILIYNIRLFARKSVSEIIKADSI